MSAFSQKRTFAFALIVAPKSVALRRDDSPPAVDRLKPIQPFPEAVPGLTLQLVRRMGAGQVRHVPIGRAGSAERTVPENPEPD